MDPLSCYWHSENECLWLFHYRATPSTLQKTQGQRGARCTSQRAKKNRFAQHQKPPTLTR